MQLGPTTRQPAAVFLAALTKAGGDDANGPDALREAVVDDGLNMHGWHRDYREVNCHWDSRHTRVGLHSENIGSHRVHRNDGAGESRGDQVVENLRTDLVAITAGADDCDYSRSQERRQLAGSSWFLLDDVHHSQAASSA